MSQLNTDMPVSTVLALDCLTEFTLEQP